ncbi:Leucine-rich repeat - like 10, partial [Theobroma cacao]
YGHCATLRNAQHCCSSRKALSSITLPQVVLMPMRKLNLYAVIFMVRPWNLVLALYANQSNLLGPIKHRLLNSLLLFFLVSSVRPLCHPDERSALLQFKESFVINNSASKILELSELELLDLSGNSLKLGKTGFSSLLEKLTKLQGLYLTDVRISSSLPNILANFSSLKALILSNCDLRGEFPTAIFELPALQFLILRSNPKLTGYLPDIQSNHPLLKLSLANTSFLGQLPESFGNFKSLELLDIYDCHFSGKLPCSLGNLTELSYLDLSLNNFSGPIPPSLGNLRQLMALDFSYNNFSGEIPSFIANLTQLVYLSLAANNFDRGTLSWLGTQINLTYLDLSNTGLSGKIPSALQNLTQITFLYLLSNRLEGQIPPWVGNLTKLTRIRFQENILSGPIPESIFKLENLELLHLQVNQLNGILKLDSFLELKNLTSLQLSGNNLSLLNTVGINATAPKFKILGLALCNLSEFPDFLRSQDELECLELAGNNIHGQIPKWFLRVGKETLWYLNLCFNFLTRFEELPVVLPWTSLELFDLKSNMFRGPLPHPPPSIVDYAFSNNSLSGEIPPILCNLSFLVALDLSDNNLTGMLPRCLVNQSNSLEVLNLRNNHFAGAIPSTYTKSCGLTMMDLSQNQLKGRIPRSLAHCTQLEFLNLGNNLINDTFPSWLGTLPELKVLILRANGLHGVIGKPQAKSEFSKLQVIDLSDNSLRGKLPSEYFNIWVAMELANTNSLSPYMNADTSFKTRRYSWFNHYNYVVTLANKDRDLRYEHVPDSMSAIDLSSNQFQGEIPEVIGNLKLIRVLNLSNNNITGHIPSSLGEITNLESLDLSRNKLSGQIPQQLANINFLEVFKVSYNNLEGPIPRGAQFDTFNNDSYEGNSILCGYPLSKNCGNPEVLQPPPSLISKEDEGIESSFKFGWKIVLTGYGVGLIIGLSHGYNFTTRKHEWFIKVVRKWQ